MSITVTIFDRRTRRKLMVIPFSDAEDALELAIATAKGQREIALVSNGKVHASYLDGRIMENVRKKLGCSVDNEKGQR